MLRAIEERNAEMGNSGIAFEEIEKHDRLQYVRKIITTFEELETDQ